MKLTGRIFKRESEREAIGLKQNGIRIFAPNLIVNCIDGIEQGSFFGRIYHSYSDEPCNYTDIKEMLLILDRFFDKIQFPAASTESRTFFKLNRKSGRKERVKLMQDQQVLNRRGGQATFIIQVQYRQNATWQGKIVWAEENKTQHFRSALELVKLMDSALCIQDAREGKDQREEVSFNNESGQSEQEDQKIG